MGEEEEEEEETPRKRRPGAGRKPHPVPLTTCSFELEQKQVETLKQVAALCGTSRSHFLRALIDRWAEQADPAQIKLLLGKKGK